MVLGVHFARIVIPELVHGDPATDHVRAAESLGTTPDVSEQGDVDASEPGAVADGRTS